MTVEHRSAVALQGGENDDRGKAGGTASSTSGRCRADLRRGAAAANCAGPPACPERAPTANGAERAAANGAGTRARPPRVAQAGRPGAGAGARRAAQADRAGPGTDAARAAKTGRSGTPTGGRVGGQLLVRMKPRRSTDAAALAMAS